MRRLVLLLALLALPAAAQPCTTSWTNAGGGAWSTAANWDNGVPTAASHACITLAGTYTVTVGGVTVQRLTLGRNSGAGVQTLVTSGGMSLAGGGTIRPTGVLEWTSEYLNAGTLVNAGTVRFTGAPGSRGVRNAGSLFRNEGTVTQTDGLLYLYDGGAVQNAGAWSVTGEGDLFGFSGAGTFANEMGATFVKSGGGTTTRMSVPTVTNAGAITVTGGDLQFETPVTNGGPLSVSGGEIRFNAASTQTDLVVDIAADASLLFNGVTTFVGTLSGTVAGALRVTNEFSAPSGATWDVDGPGVEWTTNYLIGGTLTNTGVVRLTGAPGSRGVRNAGATFRNEGTVTQTDGLLYLYDGGAVQNAGAWSVTGEGDLFGFSGAGTFANEVGATLTKTGSGTTTRITVPTVTNAGAVTVASGDLQFESSTSMSGSLSVSAGEIRFQASSTQTDVALTVAADASVLFNAPVTFVGTLSGAPAGTVRVGNGITAGGGATWALGGTGMEWTAEYLTGGTLTNTGTVRLTGTTGDRGVRNAGVTFRNEGTVTQTDGLLYLYDGGSVQNAGLWSVTGEGDLLGFSGGGSFANEVGATFVKSGGGTTTRVTVPTVTNAGTTRVDSGVLDLDSPFHHQAGGVIGGSGVFDLTGSAFTFAGDVAPGASPGVLTWQSTFAPSATSALAIEIGGLTPGSGHDQLAVTGTATLGGTLAVAFTGGFTPAVGQAFTLLTCGASCTGAFAAVALPFGIDADVVVGPTTVVLTVTAVDIAVTRRKPAGEVVVGPEGGEVRVRFVITNQTAAPRATQTWATLTRPGGVTVATGRARDLTLEPGVEVGWGTRLVLDAASPAGAYVFTRYIGTPGVDTLAAGTYTFTKAASAAVATLPEAAGADDEGEVLVVGASPAADVEAVADALADALPLAPEARSQALPAALALRSPAPNPSAGRAVVRYELPESADVRLVVVDALGREVAVLVDGARAAGRHDAAVSGLAPGVYVVRLVAGGAALTQRMTVVQ